MASFSEFLTSEYLGNLGSEYLFAFGVLVFLFVIFKAFDSIIVVVLKKASKKTKNNYDDMIIDFISAIHWQFYAFLAFYFSLETLVLSEGFDKVMKVLLLLFVIFYAAQGLSRVVNHFTKRQIAKRRKSDGPENTSMIKVFGVLFKIIIYIIAFLMVLSNLGVEITPLIASLGVGGIAIALALQTVLADLFAAFAIYFDKPFREGDFIIIGNDMGTVKHIGIKTTRIQSLQGQELVVSNSELTNARINNYKRMEKRRVAFSLGVEYSTPVVKLKKVKGLVTDILKTVKGADLDRVHFHKFGDFSLNYEVVYYVNTSDYTKFMDVQEDINLKLVEAFQKEGIVFAFPTQTLFVEGVKGFGKK